MHVRCISQQRRHLCVGFQQERHSVILVDTYNKTHSVLTTPAIVVLYQNMEDAVGINGLLFDKYCYELEQYLLYTYLFPPTF